MRKLRVRNSGVQLALHQRRSLVVFDVSQVSTLGHFDVFGKPLGGGGGVEFDINILKRECRQVRAKEVDEANLLLEVADGVLVSVSQEVKDVVFDVVLLQVIHQVRAVALSAEAAV